LTFRARQAKPEQAEQGGEIKGWRKAVKVQIKQLFAFSSWASEQFKD